MKNLPGHQSGTEQGRIAQQTEAMMGPGPTVAVPLGTLQAIMQLCRDIKNPTIDYAVTDRRLDMANRVIENNAKKADLIYELIPDEAKPAEDKLPF